MTVDSDNLTVLRQMRQEGRISDDEFQDLTRGLVADEPVAYDQSVEPAEAQAPEISDVTGEPGEPTENAERPTFQLRMRRDVSSAYVLSLAIGAVLVLVTAAAGMLSWPVALTIVVLLGTTLIQGARTLTLILGIVAAAVIVASLVSSIAGGSPPETQTVTATVPTPEPDPAPGSLGLYLDDVTEAWNTVDTPPDIIKGLTRYNETGEYDTFIYRFDEWGRLAGAFDPETEAVYALLATGWLSETAATSLYLHLCHMTAPYSPECIDAYHEQGLAGATLADYVDVAHQAEWKNGEHTWRLVIENNVLTIRVFGADAA